MRSYRTVRTALRALVRNPMRAALTMLGVFIGVGSVITMMALGDGSSRAIQRTIEKMGANNLMILPGAASGGGVSQGMTSAMTLTPEDAEAVLTCPAVRAVAPVVRSRGVVVHGNRNWATREVVGTTPGYLDVRDWSMMDEGAAFTDRDVRNAGKVCLLGKTIARELFGELSPVGGEVRVKNVALTVVGVLGAKGANMMGIDQDDTVLMPWTTLKYRLNGANGGSSATVGSSSSGSSAVNKINQVYPRSSLNVYSVRSALQIADTPQLVVFPNVDTVVVSARSARDTRPAIAEIADVLRLRHRISPGQPDDFRVLDMTEMTSTVTKTTDTMSVLLLCVASISLVVGGVGIMNIMLVSVTERTGEIGLRMAVGARRGDILRQFLVEAVVLCLTGGGMGIAAGLGGSWAVRHFKGWPAETSPAAIMLAVSVSGAVGILFGFYPAWKASRLDPIEAIRHE